MKTGAEFDATGCYRYWLWRSWDEQAARVGFVMLNPSRAAAVVNDPTLRRCLGLARAWGYGALEVVNLFAYCTPQPSDLRRVPDPIGAENDRYLAALRQRVDHIVLAWGNGGTLQSRDRAVMHLLNDRAIFCLGITKLGQPRHPLYVRRDVNLSPWLPSCSKPICANGSENSLDRRSSQSTCKEMQATALRANLPLLTESCPLRADCLDTPF